MRNTNPFVTIGYQGPEYFCDRQKETEQLNRYLRDGNNIVLLAHRRMGKTGLIHHCIEVNKLSKYYNVFVVDILATKNLKEFTLMLGNAIVGSLKKLDEKSLDLFLKIVSSFQGIMGNSLAGAPEIKVQYAGLPKPETSLGQIFEYISKSKKPCIVAIDEFQQITNYPEKNTEAILRTYIQQIPGSRFIFSGSERRTMSKMFTDSSRPFYQSASMIHLDRINQDKYADFASKKFTESKKQLSEDVVPALYEQFDGITWYLQKMMNQMFGLTEKNGICDKNTYLRAIKEILDSYEFIYEDALFKLPAVQKELLLAIAKEGTASNITSSEFCQKYSLSPSTVQSAKRGLLKKEYITEDLGKVKLYDLFLNLWLQRYY